MERVKKGEKYWCVSIGCEGLTVSHLTETNCLWDYKNHKTNNYFHTKEQAESMADKLRAVLKGADVIEMPSEDNMLAIIDDPCVYIGPGRRLGWIECYKWLKSKIVK